MSKNAVEDLKSVFQSPAKPMATVLVVVISDSSM